MTPTQENGYELSVSTFIDAPPALVWDVMIERMTEWWCPKPWTTEIIEHDRRPMGRAKMVMRGPDGEEQPSDGVFIAFEPGKRFAFSDAMTAELTPTGPFMIGIFEIEPEGSGTRYTARARHWTEEAMKGHRDMGFEPGWGAVAQQLKELCEEAKVAA